MNVTALIRTLEGHRNGVLTLAFSPCGKFLVTAGEDNAIKLWDVPDGIEISSLEAHAGDVRAVAFDPDGDVFASGSWDKAVKIWKTSDCSTLATASGHDGAVNCLAFSPDGKLLYSGSDDATIRCFASPGGEYRASFKPDMGDIKALAVSSSWLIAAGGVQLQLLDASGKLLKAEDSYIYGVRCLAFSPDGARLAVATGMEKRLEFWDAGKLERALSVKDADWINCVAFSHDGKYAVTGGSAIKVWDPATGACLKTLEGHSDEILCVDVSPDDKYIASASRDKTVKLWSL